MSAPIEERKKAVRIGISMGDPNGIGPEVILGAFQDIRGLEGCEPVLYGSRDVLEYYKELLNFEGPDLQEFSQEQTPTLQKPAVIDVMEEGFSPEPGKASEKAGDFAYHALARSSADVADGKLDALVTAPLHKHSVQREDRPFPGHTEYLTEYANMEDSLMLLMSEGLRVGVVTGHIPVQEIPERVDEASILSKLGILERSLQQDFLIEKPLIAVLGLNPHAGESGSIGKEEQDVIVPALEKAREEQGINAFGPFPADGFFGSQELGKYDAVLAMYHDQGLGPFKALTFDRGVNFTAGLPIIRTSPDHGTAFNLAGQGKASPRSFRNALLMAMELYRNRRASKKMTENPLQAQKGSPYMKGDKS